MDTLTPIAAQLGLDRTFWYLLGLVCVLYPLLTIFYLKPFQKLLHERRERTEGAKKEAQELTLRAEDKYAQYKKRLKEVHDQARRKMNENLDVAKKEEAQILGAAATKSKTALQSAQKELDSQRKATIDALSSDIANIATEIATKVMGRPVATR